MINPSFDGLMLLGLGVHTAVGVCAGWLYFHGLRWNVRLFAEGGRTANCIAFIIARFVLLGGLLTLASLEGAMPLLMTTLGVFLARFAVVRRAREAMS